MSGKLRVATTSLAGCFGCHMSLLDIDERILDLVELIEFDRSPLTDIKTLGDCDLGIIEGGVANADNVAVLLEFRRRCKLLLGLGACALNGGIPAMRNHDSVDICLRESYLDGVGLHNPLIPADPEIPPLLDRVRPIAELVPVDCYLPGCPPSAEAIWTLLNQLLRGETPHLPRDQIHYD